MTIAVTAWRDEGPLNNGRGIPREVTNFNMKATGNYSDAYFPTTLFAAAPLRRTLIAGEQVCSYTVYTFFKLVGSYNVIKNPRLIVSVKTTAQADKCQLFYKMTNIYKTPSNNLDGDMMLLANGNTLIAPIIFPGMSTAGPNSALNILPSYSNVSPLYTGYFVTQLRVNAGGFIGNSAEFKLRFEVKEYGVF